MILCRCAWLKTCNKDDKQTCEMHYWSQCLPKDGKQVGKLASKSYFIIFPHPTWTFHLLVDLHNTLLWVRLHIKYDILPNNLGLRSPTLEPWSVKLHEQCQHQMPSKGGCVFRFVYPSGGWGQHKISVQANATSIVEQNSKTRILY